MPLKMYISNMKIYDRVTLYIFFKYIAVAFVLFLCAKFISYKFLDKEYLDTLYVFIFSLTMAFAINEAYKKGGRQRR